MPSPQWVDTSAEPATVEGDRSDESMSRGRGSALPGPEQVAVHELVAGFAREQPSATAVQCGGDEIAYGALDAQAGRIAARLAATGVRRGDRVGLLAEPSVAMVAATLGILRAGAAYVPVDQAQPDERVAAVLDDAWVAAVVVTDATAPRLAGTRLPVVRIAAALEPTDASEPDATRPAVPVTADDAAYVIYTSGSTGEPKGVLVEHRQLAASTWARRLVYPGAPVFLLVSPLAFDSSAAGLWGTLTAGGRLVVATADEVRDPERLVALVESRQVTRLLCVPSLYRVLLDAAERVGTDRLRSLDTVTVAGEALPEELAKRHFALHDGSVALVNEYGPTETAVWASYARLDAPGPVTIGGPIPGALLYVLDEELRPVPRGVEGELFVGGAGVSRGYFGRPDATARAFPADPFAGTAGARMYRTGDLARWNDGGTLDFVGRRDHQVKIRGHRVELGAVEAALRALPQVRDAAVVADSGLTRLIGFVVADSGTSPDSLRGRLADRLPSAMVPARIHVLDGFPLNVNGKVDRAQLSAWADDGGRPPVSGSGAETTPAADTAPTPPPAPADDGMTARVTAAWAEVLKASDVPADVNFFDLGGHSLTMFHLQDALERSTGTRPSVVALFRHTTVSAQVALIRDGGAAPDESLPGMREAAARRARAVRARLQRAEREAAK